MSDRAGHRRQRHDPAPIELSLPAELALDDALGQLAQRVPFRPVPRVSATRTLLDTVDGRLYRAGLLLEQHAGEAKGGVWLALSDRGRPSGGLVLHRPRPDRLLAAELPPGQLRDRLLAVTSGRALLAKACVSSRGRTFRVLDRRGKTVLRLTVEEPSVTGPGSPAVALPTRFHLKPVRGYDAALRRVRTVLERDVGLRPADETLFGAAVRAAGGSPSGVSAKVTVALDPVMRADAAVATVLARLAEVAEAQLDGTRADLDLEFLHDLRVAVRRARSVLREMKDAVPELERRRLAEELRWVQQATGPTRDLDVQLAEWPDVVAALPPRAGAQLAPVHDVLAGRRAAAFAALLEELRSPRFHAALAAWRAAGVVGGAPRDAPGGALPIAEVAGARIRALYRRMVRDGGRIDDASPAEALHDLRKLGKELRYVLEHFGSLWATRGSRMVASLKDLQDVLGRFQDRQVQAAHLRRLAQDVAVRPGGPEALLVLALVVEGLDRDATAARAAFATRFADFASPRNRTLVATTFTSAAGGVTP